jgi:hypothetical protein
LKRIILVLAVALVMAAMVAVMAGPVFAKSCGKFCSPLNGNNGNHHGDIQHGDNGNHVGNGTGGGRFK